MRSLLFNQPSRVSTGGCMNHRHFARIPHVPLMHHAPTVASARGHLALVPGLLPPTSSPRPRPPKGFPLESPDPDPASASASAAGMGARECTTTANRTTAAVRLSLIMCTCAPE